MFIQVAAANDQVDVLYVLLEYGANIDLQNSVGWTALHQVVK
jgi:ankyrin repeat protein